MVRVPQRMREVERRCVMLMRAAPFLVIFVYLILLPSGCADNAAPPPDFPKIAEAFKFVGVCSVIASCVWAFAIIRGSDNRRK